MTQPSERNRKQAAGFYTLSGVLILAWWLLLALVPQSRTPFLGEAFGRQFVWILPIPDIAAALVLIFWMGRAISRSHPSAPAIAWIYLGAQGYAWAMTIGLASLDPRAYWGLISMTLSVGSAFAFAMRLQNVNVLWGPFAFRFASCLEPAINRKRTLRQIAAMWGVFLVLIPGAMAFGESLFHWDRSWIHSPWRFPLGIILFLLSSSLGLWAAAVITQFGQGTPLPSECPNALVNDAPYRYIRNPMAFGSIGQGVAVATLIGSPLVLVYALLGGICWEVLVRPGEENYLFETFGEAYAGYRDSIPCWRFKWRS